MKAIHNIFCAFNNLFVVVLYPKDTEKWKQFTTVMYCIFFIPMLFCIPKILKNESNSQQILVTRFRILGCFVSQRYWKMKAIHNTTLHHQTNTKVVLYPKDTEKWKQFTTSSVLLNTHAGLFCIPKILKNESNSQLSFQSSRINKRCFVSQRYWKMKAIHNYSSIHQSRCKVVLYPKDTEKWKQFTTTEGSAAFSFELFCIPKILKNESNSQPTLG